MTDRPTVRLKPSTYQPRKAELEEPIPRHKADGTRWAPEEVARALFQQVNVVKDPDA